MIIRWIFTPSYYVFNNKMIFRSKKTDNLDLTTSCQSCMISNEIEIERRITWIPLVFL